MIRETVAAAETEGWDAAFTVSAVPAHYHPLKQFDVDGAGVARFCLDEASPNVNRQSLSATYIRNGLCYAVRVAAFTATHSIHGTRAKACIIDGPAISIDSEQDLDDVRRLIEGDGGPKERIG